IEQAKITRQILHLDPSTVSRLCRLREIWETLEVADSAEALTLAESNDVALRAVGAWFNVPQPSTKSQLLTKLERTRSFATAILGRDLKQAAHELDEITSGELPNADSLLSDRLFQELRLDLSELEVALLGEEAIPVSCTYFGTRAHSSESTESERRFALERLAELDERRNDKEGALLFRRALSEEFPNDIGSQIRLEELQRNLGQSSPLTAQRLSQILPPGDRDAYGHVLGLSALVQSDLRTARKFLEPALGASEPSLSALRALVIIAREKRDDDLLAQCYKHLAKQDVSTLDQVCINHELALVSARTLDLGEARRYLNAAIELSPAAFPLRYLQNYLEKPDSALKRAEQTYVYAHACAAATHR